MHVTFNWKCLDTKLPNLEERIVMNTPFSKKNSVFIGYLEKICICPVVGDKIYTSATIEQVRNFSFNDEIPVELEIYIFNGYDFNYSSLTKSKYHHLYIPTNQFEKFHWDYFYTTWLMPDTIDYQSVNSMFYD